MKDKIEIIEAIAACDDVLNNIDRALAGASSYRKTPRLASYLDIPISVFGSRSIWYSRNDNVHACCNYPLHPNPR